LFKAEGKKIITESDALTLTEDQFALIRRLAALNWPLPKIAEPLGLSSEQFIEAIVRCPEIKTAYDAGLEDKKAYIEKQAAWQPTPEDVAKAARLAATGLGEVEIAGQLDVRRAVFIDRLQNNVHLKSAFEQGQAEHRTYLLEEAETMLRERDPDLRHVGQLLTFMLKAYCGLGEAQKPVILEGKIEHTHKLKAPAPVAIEDINSYAKIEMQRANKINAEKLKAAGIVDEIESIVNN
jgi:hypothetical protein